MVYKNGRMDKRLEFGLLVKCGEDQDLGAGLNTRGVIMRHTGSTAPHQLNCVQKTLYDFLVDTSHIYLPLQY